MQITITIDDAHVPAVLSFLAGLQAPVASSDAPLPPLPTPPVPATEPAAEPEKLPAAPRKARRAKPAAAAAPEPLLGAEQVPAPVPEAPTPPAAAATAPTAAPATTTPDRLRALMAELVSVTGGTFAALEVQFKAAKIKRISDLPDDAARAAFGASLEAAITEAKAAAQAAKKGGARG